MPFDFSLYLGTWKSDATGHVIAVDDNRPFGVTVKMDPFGADGEPTCFAAYFDGGTLFASFGGVFFADLQGEDTLILNGEVYHKQKNPLCKKVET